MTNLKKWIAGAGVGLALMTVGAVALPIASANTVAAPAYQAVAPGSGSTQQAPGNTAPNATAPDVAAPKGSGLDMARGIGGRGVSGDYLAQALGITTDELAAAQQAAASAAIDKALAEGLITQEQADTLKSRLSSDDNHGLRGLRLRGAQASAIDMDALLAQALGISTDQLSAAKTEAQQLALDAAIADGSITQEQADAMEARQALQQYLEEQDLQGQTKTLYESMVQQAVQAGVITQAQADAILSSGGGMGRHGMGMPGGMGGYGGRGGRGGSFTQPSNAAPTTDGSDL